MKNPNRKEWYQTGACLQSHQESGTLANDEKHPPYRLNMGCFFLINS
jgi:hypothetical protein